MATVRFVGLVERLRSGGKKDVPQGHGLSTEGVGG